MGKIINAYIVPHPPIIVPEVGKGREVDAIDTIEAMKKVASDVAKDKPSTIILSSPHAPYLQDYLYVEDAEIMSGDFSSFGYLGDVMEFNNNLDLARLIVEKAMKAGIQGGGLSFEEKKRLRRSTEGLDHGSLVPLYYIAKEYTDFKLVLISTPYMPLSQNFQLGKAIAEAITASEEEVVYIASGDLSHRLAEDGPMSYSSIGQEYDHYLIRKLEERDVEGLLDTHEDFIEAAGECGTRSFVMMLGVLDGLDTETEMYSYEGPYGVGYLVGKVHVNGERQDSDSQRETQNKVQGSPHVRLAKEALEVYVKEGRVLPVPSWVPEEFRKNRAGVFVTLKINGDLRGCIGTIGSVRVNIAEEIIYNAISAGTKDPRFDDVLEEELSQLEYSVDVLGMPEEIQSMDQLDVKRYGVIVTSGWKRGLLLPDLEGVDTPEEQVHIALQKAGIGPSEKYEMKRFEVIRYY
ncbi:MAG: AmmeMemoRadiSam system protein A [Anaerovoracaceae bacterium]